jgi:putative ABC transport system substrate-binding protein
LQSGSPHVVALAIDLLRRQSAVIVAVGTDRAAAAARAADTNIPIVFISGIDPVLLGFVASFSRPGGNMTGTYSFNVELIGKTLGLLHELVPKATTIALLQSSDIPQVPVQLINARQVAAALGLQLLDFNAVSDREIEAAFAHTVDQRAEALLVLIHPFFVSHAEWIATLAARYGLPAIYGSRDFVLAGGLISYGDNVAESYRQIGLYVGRILKGE